MTDKAGTARSTCTFARGCRCSAATVSAQPRHHRSTTPNIRCPRVARQRPDLRAQQAARDSGSRGHPRAILAARGALRVVGHAGRQIPLRPGHHLCLRRVRARGPADRSAHCRRTADAADHGVFGSRPPGHQPAVAVSDGLQPEDQLHLAGGTPLAQNGLRVPAHRHGGPGRQPALRPRSPTTVSSRARPAPAASNLYNLADFMLGPPQHVLRSATCSSRNLRQNMHFAYVQDDFARE